jgi:hypothetical protein
MSQTVAWIGTYFFGFLMLGAIVMDLRKKQPREAYVLIGSGGFVLCGICGLSAMGHVWKPLASLYFCAAFGSLLFFWGVVKWRAHYLKKKERPQQ